MTIQVLKIWFFFQESCVLQDTQIPAYNLLANPETAPSDSDCQIICQNNPSCPVKKNSENRETGRSYWGIGLIYANEVIETSFNNNHVEVIPKEDKYFTALVESEEKTISLYK